VLCTHFYGELCVCVRACVRKLGAWCLLGKCVKALQCNVWAVEIVGWDLCVQTDG
jgi:hypothetical protein